MMPLYDNLPEPAPLEKGSLRIVPLGGLGEVGRNMNVLEFDGKLLVVDCGVLFPEESQPGVDLILPDFSWLEDRLDDIVGMVLTHGHEDHIGAVPYLLKLREDIPIYGSDLTLAFVEPKLREHRLSADNLRVVAEGDRQAIGPFDCEFVAVTHSIPDALALFVRTPAGKVLIRFLPRPRGRLSSHPSLLTFTACSRSSMQPLATGVGLLLLDVRWNAICALLRKKAT